MKEPPDPDPDSTSENHQNFRTVKVPLKKVLKHYELIHPKIEDTVLRANQLASVGYEFMKLYVLHRFEHGEELPKINDQLLTKIFRLIGRGGSGGKPPKADTATTDSLTRFYHDHILPIYPEKVFTKNMSYVIGPMKKEMVKCFDTNLSTHFGDYVRKYVNVTFKIPAQNEIRERFPDKADRKPHYQALNKEIADVKWDLFNLKCDKSDPKYHRWLTEQIAWLFPFKRLVKNQNVAYDVKANTQRYLKPALMISRQIERLGRKPYQVMPLRSSFVPKAITLDTSGLVEVINDTKKRVYKFGYTKMSNNAKKYQKHTWKEALKLECRGLFEDSRKEKWKGQNDAPLSDFVFRNHISTDGVSANILFIHKDHAEKKYGEKIPEYDDSKDCEPTRLNSLTRAECVKYQDRVMIGIDPGKCDLFTMASCRDPGAAKDSDKYRLHSFSNRRRQHETYAHRSREVLYAEKRKHGITSIETELSKNTKKGTMDFATYKRHLVAKGEVKGALDSFYQRPLFRKLALRRYCATISSEARMLNDIEARFGEASTLLLGLGNWSSNDAANRVKGCNATPNKRFTKLLKRRFDVVSVDEFNTSKLYNKDPSVELENVMVKRKGCKRRRRCHRLLTPKRNPNGVIVNRDSNAAKNILHLLEEHILYQRRPAAFCPKKRADDRVVSKQPEGNQVLVVAIP